jgi:hypothetical protein
LDFKKIQRTVRCFFLAFLKAFMHDDNREIYTGNNRSFAGRMVAQGGDARQDKTDNSLPLSGVFKGKIDIISFNSLHYPFKEMYYEKNNTYIPLTGSHFNHVDCRMHPGTNIACTNAGGNPSTNIC